MLERLCRRPGVCILHVSKKKSRPPRSVLVAESSVVLVCLLKTTTGCCEKPNVASQSKSALARMERLNEVYKDFTICSNLEEIHGCTA
jgi:hypothetical protein